MWRQGDIYIQKLDKIPKDAEPRKDCVLAEGEVTGHKHQIKENNTAELYEKDGTLYLKVKADSASVVHEQHKPIVLEKGCYRVWRQREYTPEAIRFVQD